MWSSLTTMHHCMDTWEPLHPLLTAQGYRVPSLTALLTQCQALRTLGDTACSVSLPFLSSPPGLGACTLEQAANLNEDVGDNMALVEGQ